MWECSAQLLVLSSYILKTLSIAEVLHSMFYYFFQQVITGQCITCILFIQKIIMTDLHWCEWRKNIYSSVTGYRTIPRKERSKCRETEAPDMQHRVACPCESIWLTVHSRVTVCCETKRFSKAEVRIPVLDNRSQLKSSSMCKISPQQILVHSNDVKWSIWYLY